MSTQSKDWNWMRKSISMDCKSELRVCGKCNCVACWTGREQLIHQLKLNEKEHDEKLQREKAKRMAKVQVRNVFHHVPRPEKAETPDRYIQRV